MENAQSKRGTALTWALVLLNLAVLGWLALREADLIASLAQIRALDGLWCAAAVLSMLVYLALEAACYAYAARRCGMPLGYAAITRCSLAARFYTLITPAGSGGQPMFIAMCVREGGTVPLAGATLSLRYIGFQVGYMAAALVCCIISREALPAVVKAGLALGFAFNLGLPALLLLFARWPAMGRWLAWKVGAGLSRLRLTRDPQALRRTLVGVVNDFHAAMNRAGFSALWRIALTGVLQVAALALVVPLVNRAFGLSAPFFPMAVQGVVLTTAVSAVPTPGNTGAAEGAFYALFGGAFPGPMRFTALLVWRCITYYLPLILGVLAFAARRRPAASAQPATHKEA